MVVEPSGAVPLAVVLYSDEFAQLVSRIARAKGSEVVAGIVFSGGNVELAKVLRAITEA
jgi:threonine dehydratase